MEKIDLKRQFSEIGLPITFYPRPIFEAIVAPVESTARYKIT
jgi:hypothetical protein